MTRPRRCGFGVPDGQLTAGDAAAVAAFRRYLAGDLSDAERAAFDRGDPLPTTDRTGSTTVDTHTPEVSAVLNAARATAAEAHRWEAYGGTLDDLCAAVDALDASLSRRPDRPGDGPDDHPTRPTGEDHAPTA